MPEKQLNGPDEDGGLVPAEFTRDLDEALANLVPKRDQRQNVINTVTQVVVRESIESFSGQLPHPSHFEQYENILPGSADRILKLNEQRQEHQMDWESYALRSENRYRLLGLASGLCVSLALIISAVVCALNDQEVVGGALVAAAATGMVWNLIQGRKLWTPEGDKSQPDPAEPARQSSRDRGKRRR
jgi:uncharacterized membrane protein